MEEAAAREEEAAREVLAVHCAMQVVPPASQEMVRQSAVPKAICAVGCVGQSCSGPGSCTYTVMPCCYGPVCCAPPFFIIGGLCSACDAEDPALSLFGDGAGNVCSPACAWFVCTPVCVLTYLPLALLGCCRPDLVNVGPFCFWQFKYASLGTRHTPCGHADDISRADDKPEPGPGGSWVGDMDVG